MEKLDFLIEYLSKENSKINLEKLPKNKEAKKILWRSLCNIREAKPIAKEYQKIEKEYLQEELNQKGIVKIEAIQPIFETISKNNVQNKDKICLWKGDITTLAMDCIVNAANSQGLRLLCSLPFLYR